MKNTPRDTRFLALAADLALLGRGRVEPNPMVGAVIVHQGQVIATGYHAAYGLFHAERVALRGAHGRARGATLYVTLEPCSTFGKTPPCVDSVLLSGVKRVVVGALDPNPVHRGKGVEILRRGGCEVDVIPHRACLMLARRFRRHLRSPRPFVTAKWAMTADGFIATSAGHSRWVSGREARLMAYRERACSDGVLVGEGTVEADDPRLTVRGVRGLDPVRIVLDGRVRMSPRSRLAHSARKKPVWLLACRDSSPAAEGRVAALRSLGVRVLIAKGRRGRLDLAVVLALLRREGIGRLLVEGGADVLGQVVRRRLVDRALVFVAPKLVGGEDGLSPLAGVGRLRMDQAMEFASPVVRQLGRDVVIEGYFGGEA